MNLVWTHGPAKWELGRPSEPGWYWVASIFRDQVVRVAAYVDKEQPAPAAPFAAWQRCVAWIRIPEPPPTPTLKEVTKA